MIRDWQGRIWEYRENIFDWITISYCKWSDYTSWQQFSNNKWYAKEEIVVSDQAKTFWWWLTQKLIGLEWQISPQYNILISRTPTKWYGYASWQTLAGTSGKWYGD
jgi:hypothetical protein